MFVRSKLTRSIVKEETVMFTVFTICAVGGSVIMVCQLVMTMMGMDGAGEDMDIGEIGDDIEMGDEFVDTHQLSTLFFGVLSFRSIVAALAFFGIGGHIGIAAGFPSAVTFLLAAAMGVVAMVLVAWLMHILYNLRSEGNVNIMNTVGTVGTVYLTIPPDRSATGKVTVSVQNRSMEYLAVTNNSEEIPTGTRVVVSGVSDINTLEVERDKGE